MGGKRYSKPRLARTLNFASGTCAGGTPDGVATPRWEKKIVILSLLEEYLGLMQPLRLGFQVMTRAQLTLALLYAAVFCSLLELPWSPESLRVGVALVLGCIAMEIPG